MHFEFMIQCLDMLHSIKCVYFGFDSKCRLAKKFVFDAKGKIMFVESYEKKEALSLD